MDKTTALNLITDLSRRRIEADISGLYSTDYAEVLYPIITENHRLLGQFDMGYNSPVVVQLARETLSASETLSGHYVLFDCVKDEDEVCDCEDCRSEELQHLEDMKGAITANLENAAGEPCDCDCAECRPEPLAEDLPLWLDRIAITATWDADFAAAMGEEPEGALAFKVVTETAKAFAAGADTSPEDPYLSKLEEVIALSEETIKKHGL